MPKALRSTAPSDVAYQTANRTLVGQCHPDDRHDPAKTGPVSRRTVTVNMREHAIGWLFHRRLISAAQYGAAERLRADYERAGLGPQVTMQWDRPPGDKAARAAPRSSDPTLAQIDARRRFDAALAAVGPGLSEICWRLICAGESMAHAEQGLGWPARSGRVVLGLALDRLVDFYGVR